MLTGWGRWKITIWVTYFFTGFVGSDKNMEYYKPLCSPSTGWDSQEIEWDLRTGPPLPVSGGKRVHTHTRTLWHRAVNNPLTLSTIPYILEWDHPHSHLITSPPPWPQAQHPSSLLPSFIITCFLCFFPPQFPFHPAPTSILPYSICPILTVVPSPLPFWPLPSLPSFPPFFPPLPPPTPSNSSLA